MFTIGLKETRLDTARVIKIEEKEEEKEEEEEGKGRGRAFKVKPEKKFPKIASIDPHNVCTKFIVRYNKFK